MEATNAPTRSAGVDAKPWYKRWYVWVIAVLLLCVIGMADDDEDASVEETVEEETAIEETVEEDEEATAIAGTDASEYADSVAVVMTESDDASVDVTDGDDDGTVVYETATACHTLEVVADADTDEIVSVALDTLAYSEDVDTYNLLTAAINRSDVDGLDWAASREFLLSFYGGDANDKTVSGVDTSSLGTSTALYTLEANDDGLPTLTIAVAG